MAGRMMMMEMGMGTEKGKESKKALDPVASRHLRACRRCADQWV